MRSARDRRGRFVSTSTPPKQVDEPTKPSTINEEELKRLQAEAKSKPGIVEYLKIYASYQTLQEKAIQAGRDSVYNKKRVTGSY